MHLLILFVLLLGFSFSAQGETIKLPVTADAGISSERGHKGDNGGASVTVPVRQNQNWSGFENKAYLMRFDTAPLAGMTVSKAWLNIFLARGDLYAIGVCTVLSGWEEGRGLNGQTGRGGASWNWASEPKQGAEPGPDNYWAWPGSGLYSVSWAHPDLRYHHAGLRDIEKKQLENGIMHLRFPVAPQQVEALAAGLAAGLILTDDKGQVAEGLSLKGSGTPYRYDHSQDIYLYTRDIQEPSLRPFLEVEGEIADRTPPGSVGELEVVSTDPFDPSATVSFTAPADEGARGGALLGYDVRYSTGSISESGWEQALRLPLWCAPRPRTPGSRESLRVLSLAPGTYSLAVRAVDEAGNRGPLSQCRITIPEVPEVKLEVPWPEGRMSGGRGVRFENLLEVWACSDLTKVDPVSGGVLRDSENYLPAGDLKIDNQVWSAARRTISLTAARGEVVACQLILERLGENRLSNISIVPGDLKSSSGLLKAEGNISCYRVWYMDVVPRKEELIGPWELVEEKDHKPGWQGDACLPLDDPFETTFSLPSGDNLGPSQRNQSVWVDIFVPPDTKPGRYEGQIAIRAKELDSPARVVLELEVLPAVMSGKISWTVELNGYEYGIESLFGVSPEDEPERYLEIERRCYQLAHQHRSTLNILPYSQSGHVQKGSAPPLKGNGKEIEVASWKEWDSRFGDYLSGKAFTSAAGYRGPGEGVPLAHKYLPFHENWPMSIKEHYGDWAELTHRDDYVEWTGKARPLEEAFSQDYQEGMRSVVRQFYEHFERKKYTETNFQFYFNNKYYFKVNFFAMPEEGRGSSFWLLDEPVDFDDYEANRFFLSLVKKGCEQAGTKRVGAHFRTDVSQPEMSRGLWDGICNLWNSSGLFDFATTAAFRMKRIPDEKYWHYGGGPGVADNLVTMEKSFFTFWAIGSQGDLPYWDTLRGEGWFRPNDLSILYPGTSYARSGKNYNGPVASVRLKTIRRGQQDIEYLNLLTAKNGWSRSKVRKALAAWADDPQAAVLTFRNLGVDRLFQLRGALQNSLNEL